MSILATTLVALIALLHVYIMVLEMFLWTTPRALKAFGLTPEFAAETKVLAANQGLYNGFLAAGLIWSLVYPVPGFAWQLAMFFLACIAVAGIFGAVTSSRRILFIQTVPAVLAMLALMFV
ncbi:DUF1304 domain-containing protein [Devosia beringensis]|uniref:DUF1304 domain-containing protein n=1 Tax=Devosia beringensis TaxID=2657486 RepID=UPI00186B7508|nr:DUF1304 domain-containing protein [Devosia beringensis]